MYNYSKLKGRIVEVMGSQKEFAKALGINASAVNCKLQGKRQFSQHEIAKSIEILGLENPIPYFFTK